jgi:hypothetical protein
MINDLSELIPEDKKNALPGIYSKFWMIYPKWNLILEFPSPVLTKKEMREIFKKEKIVF